MSWRVKNWKDFQHFKDRKPPWIKLYRDLLDDPDWHELDGDDAKALVMLWLIASEDGGNLPDIRKISFRLRTTQNDALQLLNRLSHWLEQDDISAISERHHGDAPETEEETEREEEKTANAVVPVQKEYAFNGGVIKLSQKHFDSWTKAYANLPLQAELTARDAYLSSDRATNDDRKNWFISTSKYLANRSSDVLANAQAPPVKQIVDGRL